LILVILNQLGIGGLAVSNRFTRFTKGTTNEQAMHLIDTKLSLDLKIVTADDHEQSYQMLVDKKVDAFANDDILLYGH
jgi:ABC-type amino acid transport substrate-binding protein